MDDPPGNKAQVIRSALRAMEGQSADRPWRPGFDHLAFQNEYFRVGRAMHDLILKRWARYPEVFEPLGEKPLSPWCMKCCSQFAVRAERIRSRPRSFYVGLLENMQALSDEGRDWACSLAEDTWDLILNADHATAESTC